MRTLIGLVLTWVAISMVSVVVPYESWAQPPSTPLFLLDVSPEGAQSEFAVGYSANKRTPYQDLYYWDGRYWGERYDFVYGYGYGYQYGHPNSWGQPRDNYRYSKRLRNKHKTPCVLGTNR